jgi:hypothetical protein
MTAEGRDAMAALLTIAGLKASANLAARPEHKIGAGWAVANSIMELTAPCPSTVTSPWLPTKPIEESA